MGLHRFTANQRLPITLEEAWEFFSDPRNLAVITPPGLGFKVNGDLPERMYPGMIITYRVRPLLRVPVRWVTEITHCDPPTMFVDEQRMGPYRLWHHQHHFIPVEGGVEMRDIIHYRIGFSVLGDIANALVVGAKIRGIFDYRKRVIEKRFGRLEGWSPDNQLPS